VKTKVIAKADETLANRMAARVFPFEQIGEAIALWKKLCQSGHNYYQLFHDYI